MLTVILLLGFVITRIVHRDNTSKLKRENVDAAIDKIMPVPSYKLSNIQKQSEFLNNGVDNPQYFKRR